MKIKLGLKKLIVHIGLGGYLTEFCGSCGIKQPLDWYDYSGLWEKLKIPANTCLCPKCFDKIAATKNMMILWRPFEYIDISGVNSALKSEWIKGKKLKLEQTTWNIK